MSLTEFAMLFEPFYQKKASETKEIIGHDAYEVQSNVYDFLKAQMVCCSMI